MSDTVPEPLDPNFQIALGAFEGPLDLLLHLIKKHELDILDLPIAFVTERYLEYVSLMEKLNLDVASEYLVMAATLAHIKSKMLLPQEPTDQDEEELEDEIDPRQELIRRLLEYQKYKRAAEQLGSRGIAGRDVFGRGSEAPQASGPPPLAQTGLFKLLDAFNKILARAKADLAFEVTAEGVSIQDRMRQLVDRMREHRELTFERLFEGQVTVYDLVVTFLALLEMAKRRLVRIYQADPHSPIHLRSTVLAEDAEGGEEVAPWPPAEAAFAGTSPAAKAFAWSAGVEGPTAAGAEPWRPASAERVASVGGGVSATAPSGVASAPRHRRPPSTASGSRVTRRGLRVGVSLETPAALATGRIVRAPTIDLPRLAQHAPRGLRIRHALVGATRGRAAPALGPRAIGRSGAHEEASGDGFGAALVSESDAPRAEEPVVFEADATAPPAPHPAPQGGGGQRFDGLAPSALESALVDEPARAADDEALAFEGADGDTTSDGAHEGLDRGDSSGMHSGSGRDGEDAPT